MVTRIELTDIEIPARGSGFHLVIENGVVVERSKYRTAKAATRAVVGQGCAAVPALYDHHHHITAAVARAWSCDIGHCPDAAHALMLLRMAKPHNGMLRVVGYDDTRHGEWTRATLDAVIDVPVKVQHRGGHMWVMNTAALALLPTGGHVPADGRLYDQDARLDRDPLSLSLMQSGIAAHVGRLLQMGVAGCNDMTAHLSADDWANIQTALPPNFSAVAFGDPDGGLPRSKVIVAEHSLPTLDDLHHLADRLATRDKIAVHAVTYEALVLALVGLGVLGDKLQIEHAFLADTDMIDLACTTGVSLGVQPGFIWSQGDRIIRDLGPSELSDYQPLRRLHAAGLRLLGGTDAPFAPVNPWTAMQACVSRRTRTGQVLNADEVLTPDQAFALFTRPGLCGDSTAPDIEPGLADGVIVLDRAWSSARANFSDVQVKIGAFPPSKLPSCARTSAISA